jgi:hypothetical protein
MGVDFFDLARIGHISSFGNALSPATAVDADTVVLQT